MKKVQIHVTIPKPIEEAIKALAELEGRSSSDVLEEAARRILEDRGYLPKATPEDIAGKVEAMKSRKRNKRGGGNE